MSYTKRFSFSRKHVLQFCRIFSGSKCTCYLPRYYFE